jgi:hypothetical protein
MVINTLPEAIVDTVTNFFRKYFTRKQSNFCLSRGSLLQQKLLPQECRHSPRALGDTHTTEVRSRSVHDDDSIHRFPQKMHEAGKNFKKIDFVSPEF